MGLACESASVRQVARQFGLVASTVRAIDLRYLKRWSATRRKEPLKQMGVDEIYFGKHMKFITVVSNLETGEPLWFGQDRKQETLDEFFRTQLSATTRNESRPRAWICGGHSPTALRNGPRTAASCTTSFMSYSMPTKPSMKCAGQSSSAKVGACACGEGQTLAVVDALDESGQPETPAVKRAVRPQSTGDEGLSFKGKFGTVVDLPL